MAVCTVGIVLLAGPARTFPFGPVGAGCVGLSPVGYRDSFWSKKVIFLLDLKTILFARPSLRLLQAIDKKKFGEEGV